ncbi:hypothetical protein [Campylobacter sp. RM16192]|uniref:hypothetical protein n=1 Tax=Campylobacter sp. RM16192 TaxID=1660080 RepID=UPI0014516E17|nr:hypothetical protein [Campylobacter sp. RM16192]QCD52849.1 hypothetical protein CDOMC_1242 [Campylobacter sp. RM16192]
MNDRNLTEKEALEFLGFSPKSNILAKMRMKKNAGKWEFTPRYITINGRIRYPLAWLKEDTEKLQGA